MDLVDRVLELLKQPKKNTSGTCKTYWATSFKPK